MSTLVDVNITLKSPATGEATLARLKDLGLVDAQWLEAIGIVIGRAPTDRLQALSRVPGVVVTTDDRVQLPPPDSPVQ